MNSKEALKDLRDVKGWNDVEFNKRLVIIAKDLQRNEPMKVITSEHGVHFCPNCNRSVWQIKYESYFCFRCGQKTRLGDMGIV